LKKSNNYQTKFLPALIGLLPAFAFLILNIATPRFADDYCRYALSLDLPEIVSLVIDEYTNWTGRFPVIFLTRVVFSLGDFGIVLFNLLNTLVLFLTVKMLTEIISPTKAEPKKITLENSHWSTIQSTAVFHITFYALLWFTLFRFGEVTLWKTGAIQYLWGCALALFALKPIIDFVSSSGKNDNCKPSLIYKICYPLLCFLGGAWLENLSVGVCAIWLGCFAYNARSKSQKPPPSLFHGLIAWVIGSVILIAAPGNFARSESLGDTTSILDMLPFVLERGYYYFAGEWLFLALLFSISLIYFKPQQFRRRVVVAIIFAGLGLLTLLAMVAAPIQSFVSRAAFPFEFFLICSIMALLPDYLFTNVVSRSRNSQQGDSRPTRNIRLASNGMLALTSTLFLGLGANYLLVLHEYLGVSQQSIWREDILKVSKAQGNTETIILPALYFSEVRNTAIRSINIGPYFARDITAQPDHWRNQCYAKAHDIHSVALKGSGSMLSP
jgi:hypothetical protein